MTVLGSAWISVNFEVGDAAADLKAQVDEATAGAADSAAEGGAEAGKAFGEGMTVEASKGLEGLTAGADAAYAEQTVAAGAAGAEAGKAYSDARLVETDKGNEAMEASSAESADASGGFLSGGFAAAAGGAAALLYIGDKSVKAAMATQTAQVLLGRAYDRSGLSMKSNEGAIDALQKKMEGYGDSSAATDTALGVLVTSTKKSGQAIEDVGLAAQIAAARNIPLAESTLLVSKAAQGSSTGLTRLGIISTAAGAKMKTAGPILDMLREKFGGAAKAASVTMAGSMATLKATMEDTFSKIGMAILPVLSKLLPILTQLLGPLGKALAAIFSAAMPAAMALIPLLVKLVTIITKDLAGQMMVVVPIVVMLAKAIGEILPVVAQLLPPIMQLVGMLGDALVSALSVLLPPITSVIGLVVELAQGIISQLAPILAVLLAALAPLFPALGQILAAFTPLFPVIGVLVDALAKLLVPVLGLLLPLISGVIGIVAKLAAVLVGVLADGLKIIIGWLTQGITWITQVGSHLGGLQSVFTSVFGAIQAVVGPVFTWLNTNVFQPLGAVFSGTIAGALNTFKSLWDTVWGGIKTTISFVWSFISPIITEITNAIGLVSKGIGTVTHIVGDIGGIASKALSWAGTGGLVTKPSVLGVAETGPELILNPQQTAQALAGKAITGLSSSFLAGVRGGSPAAGSSGEGLTVVVAAGAVQVIVGTSEQASAVAGYLDSGFNDLASHIATKVAPIRARR